MIKLRDFKPYNDNYPILFIYKSSPILISVFYDDPDFIKAVICSRRNHKVKNYIAYQKSIIL